jgi:hypothetical protein
MATTLTMHRVKTIPMAHTEEPVWACNDCAAALTCVRGADDTYVAAYEEIHLNSALTVRTQYLRTFKSVGDDGQTWTENPEVVVLDHVPNAGSHGRAVYNRDAGARGNPAFSTKTGEVLLGGYDLGVGTSFGPYGGSVLRSTDLGTSWARVVPESVWSQYKLGTVGFMDGPGGSEISAIGGYGSRDDDAFDQILNSGGPTLVSHDGGASFTEVRAQVMIGSANTGLTVNPTLLAGGASGHTRTQDNGATWQIVNYSGLVSPTDPVRCLFTVNGFVGNPHSRFFVLGAEYGELLEDRGAVGRGIIGLAVHPSTNVIYACTGNEDTAQPRKLCTIDPLTGAVTIIGSLGVHLGDLAFTSAGVLYGVSLATMSLYTVNLSTGVATAVGVLTGLPAGTRPEDGGNIYDYDCGIACDQSTNTLYITPEDKHSGWKLYTVNASTAACTLVATITGVSIPSGQWGGFSALLMHPNGTLTGLLVYGSSYENYWMTINKSTGAGFVLSFIEPAGIEALCYWTAPAAWPLGGPPPPAVFPNGCRGLAPLIPLGGTNIRAGFFDASGQTTMLTSSDGGLTWTPVSGELTA